MPVRPQGGNDWQGTTERARMSVMQKADKRVICRFVSDLHLSDQAPIARAEKENWQEVQFDCIIKILDACQADSCPLVIAGDIFDKWKVSPEVVNRAIEVFREFPEGVYAIPGQHDLRHHNYTDIELTSYWTLVQAEVIYNVKFRNTPIATYDKRKPIMLHPYPWGKEIEEYNPQVKKGFNVALVHKYIWQKGCSYPGAPKQAHILGSKDVLKNYDLAVFGDNHKGFNGQLIYGQHNVPIINCGGFMQRKSDEKNYRPKHAVLYEDWSVDYVKSGFEAQWIEDVITEQRKGNGDVEGLLEILTNLGEQSLDFKEAMNRYLNEKGISRGVRKIILTAMEN